MRVNITEMKCFLGVILLSGYVPLPRRMYWERSKDSNNELVSQAIAKNKFEFILSNINFHDNNFLDPSNKFAKVRPLFVHLNKKFMDNAYVEEEHSVDEAMVPYTGRHGCKQYIHGKPIRYGFKFWVGTTRQGYINWFEPYQGASTNISETYKDLGVGTSVVLEYADALRSKWKEHKFHFFFDNFLFHCFVRKS
ncbi:PiggyBac transposable element-derived protein 3 [Lucilia cuprina]|nr:PiggyBac transposable element-derived protein 3 [Lucilia cuprina]